MHRGSECWISRGDLRGHENGRRLDGQGDVFWRHAGQAHGQALLVGVLLEEREALDALLEGGFECDHRLRRDALRKSRR